ncbi:MAG TPA: YibE/F family protein [Proteiniclasticum sp.]|nr:YibE/F family protein [Proteiniclasticum sp.]
MMIGMLTAILFVLMLAVGGSRGLRSFGSLMINFMVLALVISMVARGTDVILTTIMGCLIITALTLLLNVGSNLKSLASLISIMLVLLVIGIYSGFLVTSSVMGGFSKPEYTDIVMFNLNVGINMADVAVAVILLKLLGAMIDTSVAISSFSNESVRLNPHQSKSHLFHSAMNVGRDILGTTTNTLFFAFLGSFMMLFVWFSLEGYTFAMVINSKILTRELIRIISSGLGCVLVIPITGVISTILFKKTQPREVRP